MSTPRFIHFGGHSIDPAKVAAVGPVTTISTGSSSCDWAYGFNVHLDGTVLAIVFSDASDGYSHGRRYENRNRAAKHRADFLKLIDPTATDSPPPETPAPPVERGRIGSQKLRDALFYYAAGDPAPVYRSFKARSPWLVWDAVRNAWWADVSGSSVTTDATKARQFDADTAIALISDTAPVPLPIVEFVSFGP